MAVPHDTGSLVQFAFSRQRSKEILHELQLCVQSARASGHHFAAHLGNPPYSGRSEAAPRESLSLTVAHTTLIHPGYKFEESQQRLLTD